jgi:hypothetical protein
MTNQISSGACLSTLRVESYRTIAAALLIVPVHALHSILRSPSLASVAPEKCRETDDDICEKSARIASLHPLMRDVSFAERIA